MVFAKGCVTTRKSEIPGNILSLLEASPMTYGDIKRGIQNRPSDRIIHYHLQRLREQGKVERVYVLADMSRPMYRLKVKG